MFKIGDFSKLSHVTVKKLRYYADIGLLEPDHVDPETGYRYYTVDQLPRLNRILALRDLGFSLDQIGHLLDEGLVAEQLRAMLRLRQAEVEQQIQEGEVRLARIESRLRQIEREGNMSKFDVVLKEVKPVRAACLRKVIPDYGHLSKMFSDVYGHVMSNGGQPTAPPVVVYYDPEFKEQHADVEVIAPIAADIPDGAGVVMREVPGVETMASCVMKGPYEGFGEVYTAVMKWIEDKNYRLDGATREVYLRGPGDTDNPEEYLTEIQIPVVKA